jgi:hypothetical protein
MLPASSEIWTGSIRLEHRCAFALKNSAAFPGFFSDLMRVAENDSASLFFHSFARCWVAAAQPNEFSDREGP